MTRIHEHRFPNETPAWRAARDELLRAEIELRRHAESVAEMRRALPATGALKENYRFVGAGPDLAGDSDGHDVLFSELFSADKDTLVLYSFMYPPDGKPCPACTAFLDSFNANAIHLAEAVDVAVVAKSPLPRIRRWARARGWNNFRLLSSGNNSYNADYHTEAPDGAQFPMINVFHKTGDGIVHRYGSELFFAPTEDGQHPRHMDQLWPLWNVLDMTPGGRPSGWFPTRSYEKSLAECGEG